MFATVHNVIASSLVQHRVIITHAT